MSKLPANPRLVLGSSDSWLRAIRTSTLSTMTRTLEAALRPTCPSGCAPEPSTTAVPDSFAFLAETGRCVIQAGHAFASLLADIALAEAVAKAEAAFGITVPLWRRLPEG